MMPQTNVLIPGRSYLQIAVLSKTVPQSSQDTPQWCAVGCPGFMVHSSLQTWSLPEAPRDQEDLNSSRAQCIDEVLHSLCTESQERKQQVSIHHN
eukprot:scaffold300511_cov17-Tisochrysis_lutea.AAC.1